MRGLKNLSLVLAGMSVLFLGKFDYTTSPNIDAVLEDKYKERFPYILGYNELKLGSLYIIDTKMYRRELDSKDKVKHEEDPVETINNIVNYMYCFPYNKNQNDPNKLYLEGGNCQALSLKFKELCEDAELKCDIEYTTTHMYNVVSLGEESCKVDITNKTIEIVKGE